MIDFTEILDGDAWEAFCRDYLIALGLVVEIPPARGPDGGCDLLVREQLKGALASRPFTWLVSCKHFAVGGKAVGNSDEVNIVDRLKQHRADGFIGFYSTVASASLVTKLKDFRSDGSINAFEIYDRTRIESGFHDVGLSGVLLQHLPISHTSLRPIHPLLGKYEPLPCEICRRDLLKSSLTGDTMGNIVFATRSDGNNASVVESVHLVCKAACDLTLQDTLGRIGLVTAWDDIFDYTNPLIFMRRMTGYINQMRTRPASYSKAAHDRLIDFYITVSQRTLRQSNAEDRQALRNVMEIDELGF